MVKGRIISHIANLYVIEGEDRVYYSCYARGKLRKEEITPMVGDIVEIEITEQEKKEGIIYQIYPRKNECKRPKIANLTQILLVLSMKSPKPDLLLLDKQLAFAKYLNVAPVIVFNKIDLEKEERIKQIQKIYQTIGYLVILTNAQTGQGIEEIREKLKKNITAFSGNSGVGKSTLINKIFQEEKTEEGEISQRNKKGKNTTTSTYLYKIAEQSYIADTPGFSTFDISEISSQELSQYFVEMDPYRKDCAYVGCSHIKEQECGIKKALEKGIIAKERYQSYVKIYQELKEKEERKW